MTESAPENKEALVIDLNFVPGWARKPPEHKSFGGSESREREDARGGDSRRREGGARPEFRDRKPGGGGRRQNFRDKSQGRPDSGSFPREAAEPVDERLAALEVSFLPERRGLAPLANRLAKSSRAYSLFEVAALFLSKPDYYLIKIEAPAALENFFFYQCADCKAVFLDRDSVVGHTFSKHFDKFCTKVEVESEPPKGNFVCVAKCGLSGVLLGPPNYHGYNDKVAEIHRTRYVDMPLDAYRKRIETIHDAALIEQWKDEMRKQVSYRFGTGETAVTFTRFSEAEAYFREHCLPAAVKETRAVVMPGPVAHAMEQGPLRRVIEDAWQRESRFPLKLSVILRLAFRHLGLHTFKAAGGHTFVTSVLPNAIDPAHAVEMVREILDAVSGKPGCTRAELLAQLVPAGEPAPVVEGEASPVPVVEGARKEADLKRQLQWLVEKGHIIEFSDGRMAVPATAIARVQMARPQGRKRRG
jgi:hypothetical protein